MKGRNAMNEPSQHRDVFEGGEYTPGMNTELCANSICKKFNRKAQEKIDGVGLCWLCAGNCRLMQDHPEAIDG